MRHKPVRSARLLICGIAAITCTLLTPETSFATPGNWSHRTARVLPGGRVEFLLAGPSRYAFRERVELGISLASFFLLPNVQLKVALPEQGEWAVATRHRVFAPGVLTNVFEARRLVASPMIVADTDLLMTRATPSGWVTAQVGGAWVAIGERDLVQMPALLRPRAPSTPHGLDVAVRGGVLGRRYMGRDGWFVEGEGQVHLVPAERATWLEVDAAVGLELRHLFVQFGSRSSYDGDVLSTLPRVELGFAIE